MIDRAERLGLYISNFSDFTNIQKKVNLSLESLITKEPSGLRKDCVFFGDQLNFIFFSLILLISFFFVHIFVVLFTETSKSICFALKKEAVLYM